MRTADFETERPEQGRFVEHHLEFRHWETDEMLCEATCGHAVPVPRKDEHVVLGEETITPAGDESADFPKFSFEPSKRPVDRDLIYRVVLVGHYYEFVEPEEEVDDRFERGFKTGTTVYVVEEEVPEQKSRGSN